ncbi:MAG: aromatic ring-hydroxylating dioxygenase subunit alpha [Pseudomonadota bacterium]|nr:aromatic ring-hydroxylating dioxygenase subunit alpha [Pseudomonadota bacterium]
MFIPNGWYVAAVSNEVTSTPRRQIICDVPVVLFRTASGKPVALSDRCIHRKMPLSKGRVKGEHIQCGYHGFVYDCTGKCVAIPGQNTVPRRAAVSNYPLVEKFGWLWLWLGAKKDAHADLLPKTPGLDQEGWVPFRDHLHVKANYQLLVDNLIDLSHETYVHTSSIGNASVAETPIEARRNGNEVFVNRVMRNIPPPPFFAKAGKSDANVDRYQLVHFQPPCYVHVEARTVPPGSEDPDSGVRFFVLDALVPETATTTNYYWAVSRNFRLEDQMFGEWWHDAVNRIFQEDREILEAQQMSIESDHSGIRPVDAAIDGGTILARQVNDELLASEG